jgi:hypothetical protein
MQNLDFAMLAHSGDDDLGSRVADRIGNTAKDATINDWQSVSEIGDKTICRLLPSEAGLSNAGAEFFKRF